MKVKSDIRLDAFDQSQVGLDLDLTLLLVFGLKINFKRFGFGIPFINNSKFSPF